MNIHAQEESAFDAKADQQLQQVERALLAFDPDDIEAELSGDVLTITVKGEDKIIVNRQRAARQIWMAALRKAWHFDENPQTGQWIVEKTGEELIATLQKVFSQLLNRPIFW